MDDQTAWEKRIQQRFPTLLDKGSEAEFFAQWIFTGKFVDHGANTAVCGLCGNQKLRYHFLIAHRETGEAVWVGSQCVLNFGVSKKRMTRKQSEARRARNAAAAEEKIPTIIDQLQQVYPLVTQSDQRKLRWLVGKFQQTGSFSPQDAAWVFQVMQICGIQPDFEVFPLSLRTKKEKAELAGLPLNARRLVAASLTETQKTECRKLGIRWDE
ncbi:MAG TPA: hypothetical protein VJ965_08790 [Anaerolineales bacterium]|nr:hypothetical protein [Anaerolineales bacterium]